MRHDPMVTCKSYIYLFLSYRIILVLSTVLMMWIGHCKKFKIVSWDFQTLYIGKFTLLFQFILLYFPTNAAPQFPQKLAPFINLFLSWFFAATEWRISSVTGSFAEPAGHQNPKTMPVQSYTKEPDSVRVGAFSLSKGIFWKKISYYPQE